MKSPRLELKQGQIPWIHEGYRVFAKEGPGGLKVERLSKSISKNKSSFYHHFADLDIFVDFLLNYHLDQAEVMAEKERACESLPELLSVIIEHKQDLLFNRQLRIHRERKDFERCFNITSQLVFGSILDLWSSVLGLTENTYLSKLVLTLSMENFFLQITEESLTAEWLQNYFIQLKNMVDQFKINAEKEQLDGAL
ncbi:MAG: TetR/AcrR family transcriptional regulator [Bacteroidia bacterium]|nr:TetR/AcrR family transcriptional regulator [Bacteroidia bacterium]